MDRSPVRRVELTAMNLKRLERGRISPSTSPSQSPSLSWPEAESPESRLKSMKGSVFCIMKNLLDFMSDDVNEQQDRLEVHQILKGSGLRIHGFADLRYRSREGEKPNLEDPLFWAAKRKYFEETHGHFTKLCKTKDSVYLTMRALERLGHRGRHVLDNDTELYMVGKNVLYRADGGNKADLEDLTFWEAKLHSFRAKYTTAKRGIPPPPQLVEPQHAEQWVYAVMSALEEFGAQGCQALGYSKVYIASKDKIFHEGNGFHEPGLEDLEFWMGKLQILGQTYALQKRAQRGRDPNAASYPSAVSLEQAKKHVFDAMWGLALEREGRRVLQDDDLYIAGWRDVRYQGESSHELDLEHHAYWMRRLRDFDNTYDDISRWNTELRILKTSVYNTIQELWELGRDGWRFLINDELYSDGSSARCSRDEDNELPDRTDPGYWQMKLQDLRAKRKPASPYIFTVEEEEKLKEMDEKRSYNSPT